MIHATVNILKQIDLKKIMMIGKQQTARLQLPPATICVSRNPIYTNTIHIVYKNAFMFEKYRNWNGVILNDPLKKAASGKEYK